MALHSSEAIQATEDICALCLGPFRRASRTQCNHIFCRSCILKAFKAQPPHWSGPCPMCRTATSIYRIQDLQSGQLLAKPPVTNLWGTVFVQSQGLGIASYHFDSEEDCYISYASAPDSWKLDDGSSPPAKKPFTACTWDPETRKFSATVHWDPAFQGSTKWEYEIIFDELFASIVSGRVLEDDGEELSTYSPPFSNEPDSLSYLRWTPPPTTLFSSVFVQGLAYHPDLEGIASYHFISAEECYISYANTPSTWRLDDGSQPPARKNFSDVVFDEESRRFSATVDWEPTFNGASRWTYEFQFADDFSRIVQGAFHAFAMDGSERMQRTFLDPETVRSRSPDGMVYVQKPGILMMFPALSDDDDE